ncbi:MAG: PorP/SprF family type IX secretion system membrane protein [Bacteroidales bacterium]|nr:PorP/SprF family type IX secretion system membrane protein [Bacteroidales bacterium]
MKKILQIPVTIGLGLFLMMSAVQGQDPNYSQWLNAPLYYNPAFTGLNTGIRARFSARDQWPNLPVDFRTCYFSLDMGDRNLPGSGGIGLLINRDNEGIGFIRNLSVGLSLSVRIPLARNLIGQVGIKGSVVEKWMVWNDFVFSDQLSAKYGNIYNSMLNPPDDQQRFFPDFGVGGLVQFMNQNGDITGTAGLAADHLFQPDESFLSIAKMPLPRKYVAHLDLIFTLGQGANSSQNPLKGLYDPFRINPGILYQNQNNMSTIQVGVNMLKFNIYLGGYFKATTVNAPSTSLMVIAGYRYIMGENVNLKFMYSYDIQVSRNLQGTGGAHEISLILEFRGIKINGRNRFSTCSSEDGPDRKKNYLECSPF